jgi:SpoVK/Ycf46/Vps4 family AAA+-type ATPase
MTEKFVEILDKIQDQKNKQYVDFYHYMKMVDLYYFQQQLHHPVYCNENQTIWTDPVKLSRNFDNNNTLLSERLFSSSLTEKVPDTQPETKPVIKKTKTHTIEVEIESIDDLLKIIEENEYNEETEYNIDLLALNRIKDELQQLNSMIGLEDFKGQILNQLLYFIQNLHIGIESDYMHSVLYGPPGTGKTEIATILGKMYSKIGILKNNVFKKVNRSDLVAGYLGQTAIKTAKVIDECLGGCLFIDEAYSLANNYEGDSFTRECIDTLCESLSKHKGELMVIIAGYKEELKATFFCANRGLESRFIWRFYLEKYDFKELYQIFNKKVRENNWNLQNNDCELLVWFKNHSTHFKHFGRDIEQLFSYVKISHGRRIYGKKEQKKLITIDDVNNGFKQFEKHNSLHEDVKPPIYGLYV